MLLWSIQISVVSIILIFLVHHLILFFKNTLTIPKVKDLVTAPIQNYEDMFEIIHSAKITEDISREQVSNNSKENGTFIHSLDELIPKNQNYEDLQVNTNLKPSSINSTNMKDELKTFFKKQLNSDKNSKNQIVSEENEMNSFSSYVENDNFSVY